MLIKAQQTCQSIPSSWLEEANGFWDGCFEGTILNTQVREPDLQTVSLVSQKRATSVQNLH